MKLLLDENLSRRIIPLIENTYPDSTHVTLVGLERTTDLVVWEYAKKHELMIVTKDSDFYDLSLIQGAPPKIIWLKKGNCSKQEIAKILVLNKSNIEEALKEHNHSCIELY